MKPTVEEVAAHIDAKMAARAAHIDEPYESLVAKILAATAKEEREKSPHTPLKEKEEAPRTVNARARGS